MYRDTLVIMHAAQPTQPDTKRYVSTIEIHPQRADIERRILANESLRKIASTVDPPVDHQAIQRYKRKFLAAAVSGQVKALTCKALVEIDNMNGRYDISVITRDAILGNLWKIATEGRNESARVRASELCGKELSMFVDQSLRAIVDLNKAAPNLATLPQAHLEVLLKIYRHAQSQSHEVIDVTDASTEPLPLPASV